MKKLYRKGTVHPSPPQIKSDDKLLHLLPVAILSLAAALSPDDRKVLAYLISTASYSNDRNSASRLNKTEPEKHSHSHNHSPLFHCDCFSCYTSYWLRWDSSPSRQLIHEIINAFEDSLEKKKKKQTKKKKNKNGKKDRRNRSVKSPSLVGSSFSSNDTPSQLSESIGSPCTCSSLSSSELVNGTGGCKGSVGSTEEFSAGDVGAEAAEEEEKGNVSRFVSFIGEKVFGVWR